MVRVYSHILSWALPRKKILLTSKINAYASLKTNVAAATKAKGPEKTAQKATWGRYVNTNRPRVIAMDASMHFKRTGATAR